jgi:hypothetical protein
VQYDDKNNEFEKLMSKFENMLKELDDLRRKQRKQARELETKERKQARVDLYLEDSQELAVRAFLDYVLYIFYVSVLNAPFDVPVGLIFYVGHIPQGILTIDFQFNVQDLAAIIGEFWRMLN